MNEIEKFNKEKKERIASYSNNKSLVDAARKFMNESTVPKYSYNFTWMGRPIIQYPQDMIAMQEIIWDLKPDLIIETGIAHGGSLIFYASLLELIGKGEVLGIDIDIRQHNKIEIEKHPMFKRIKMIEGSSIDENIVEKVRVFAKDKASVLVVLDSNHTHEHVLKELQYYAPLTTINSYCVVFDTVIEEVPDTCYPDRSWGVGNNPKTAVMEYLASHPNFKIDEQINNKLLITVARDGYLKRIR